jgi:hypothetical protein
MDELLARAMQGVDPQAPGAFARIMLNLLDLMPWVALFWWNVAFLIVGALIGWRRGRIGDGLLWALLLGPIGWFVVWRRPARKSSAQPPPLPR